MKNVWTILNEIEQNQSLRNVRTHTSEDQSTGLNGNCEDSLKQVNVGSSHHFEEGKTMATIDDVYGEGEWLKAADLDGRQVVVKITSTSMTVFDDKRSGEKKKQIVLHFEGKKKKLGLNLTNAKKVASICESKNTDDWIGHSIMLYPTEVEAFGETTEAIRIRAVPTSKARPHPPAPSFEDDLDEIPF